MPMECGANLFASGDIGGAATQGIIDGIRKQHKVARFESTDKVREAVRSHMVSMLKPAQLGRTKALDLAPRGDKPAVLFIMGPNGSGKTTTISKLCNIFTAEGRTVVVAAMDQTRPAAVDQLKRVVGGYGFDVVDHTSVRASNQKGLPKDILRSALRLATDRKAKLLICDTAGRLHNKKELVQELMQFHGLAKGGGGRVKAYLVLDGSNGQTALTQANVFHGAVPVDGIILTKMDGTAKAGFALQLANVLQVPICYLGVGETPDSLVPFDPDRFVDQLLSSDPVPQDASQPWYLAPAPAVHAPAGDASDQPAAASVAQGGQDRGDHDADSIAHMAKPPMVPLASPKPEVVQGAPVPPDAEAPVTEIPQAAASREEPAAESTSEACHESGSEPSALSFDAPQASEFTIESNTAAAAATEQLGDSPDVVPAASQEDDDEEEDEGGSASAS
eukprot:gene1106-2653_t